MTISRVLRMRTLFILLGVGAAGFFFWTKGPVQTEMTVVGAKSKLSKSQLSETLESAIKSYQFPSTIQVNLDGKESISTKVEYSFNAYLQKTMENLINSYSPDYAAFVAIDPATGRVLSMVSRSKFRGQENLAVKASFPSASVFKIVTAAAAIEGNKVSAETVLPFNGRKHTLYKSQILKTQITPWTQYITFKSAFAHSINTVFGKLGAYTVGSERLREYAGRFGFNSRIDSDFPVEEGRAYIPNDAWGLAESASGFTRENTMSPLQGALMAAAIANDGVMMAPYAVQSILKDDGTLIYTAEPQVKGIVIDPETAVQIRTLMKETVRRGTSRGAFRGFFKGEYSLLDVGGKTGSLTGYYPRGKYDWFVGYADAGTRRIAFAVLTINERLWSVKSAYLARRAIESYFKSPAHFRKNLAAKEL